MNRRNRLRSRSDDVWAAERVQRLTADCTARARWVNEVLYWIRDWEDHLIGLARSGASGNPDDEGEALQ